ncbi:serine/arginine repetitive matrix protein 4 isoform X1 [Erpetoichthys calabaricus]|uniref:serine/arginine repetitive matrix protein 4 isoform X1 n=1 Tax=Erpetoichthys calabaricus TaxID=27687 RepID=UPI002234DDA3|nr:serine/arginine repetitive matrix protein 4 isoform X1 [Erpetoichthys calabaricus]
MASVQQGEKQLFEKFWKGTFKAVATPRPESIIIASITARRTVLSTQKKAEETKAESINVTQETSRGNECAKVKDSKHHSPRSSSHSFDKDLSPLPAHKRKKKKKSERKRRRRSPSYSPSPIRKKKKKSSKKRKRNRLASKKRRHSSSSPKSKRKSERKHRKRSRGRPSRRHRCQGSDSESPTYRSLSNDSRHRYHSPEEVPERTPSKTHSAEDRVDFSAKKNNSALSKSLPSFHTASPVKIITLTGSAADIITKRNINHDILSNQNKERQDYDSGNDTSSPPSSKASSSRSKIGEEKNKIYQVDLPLPETLRFTDADNGSDSGNSVTSYSSLSKPLPESLDGLTNVKAPREITSLCPESMEEQHKTGQVELRSQPCSPRSRNRSVSSRSSNRSLHSCGPRPSPHYSRSSSLSSGKRSVSRSSYSAKSRKRSSDSRSSRSRRSPSYSRYSPDRDREREREHKKYSSSEKEVKRDRERRRRRSYSPMRKRRRDSPSHLEARRITSARKRPIPYYRPSPSSSSRSSSCSSWYSSRSRSRSWSRSRSRSRSRSYSTYRSQSRSPSWSSGSRSSRSSRCQSYDSVGSYSRDGH